VILDDIQSTQNLSQTRKLLDYFRQDVMTRPGADGRVVIVGTRIGHGDFYEALLAEEELVDDCVTFPAIDGNGEALWPERWPVERLERRRKKVGDETWSRVYMQEPASAKTATFTDEMIEACLDRSRPLGHRGDLVRTVCGLDPALGGWTALVTAAYDTSSLVFTDVEVEHGMSRTEDILAMIARTATKYRPSVVIVEKDGFQKGLVNDDRLRDLARAHGFIVQAHETKGQKANAQWGLASMAGAMLRGELKLAYGDDNARLRMAPLIEEMRTWRPDIPVRKLRQDALMGAWFVWRNWEQEREQLNHNKVYRRWVPSWMEGSRRGQPGYGERTGLAGYRR